MNVDIINNTAGFKKLRGEWNTLLDRSRSDSIFLTWEWLYTWWDVFGKNNELCILTSRDPSGALRGISPMYVKKTGILEGLNVKELKFIGTGADVSSEYMDFICDPGLEQEIMNKFMDFLFNARGAWHILSLNDMSQKSENICVIMDYLTSRGINSMKLEQRPSCPIVRLPATWNEYLMSLPKRMRSNVRTGRKKIEKEFENVSFSNPGQSSIDNKFDAFMKLHSERRGQKNSASKFKNKEYERFQKGIYSLFSKNNKLNLFFLSFNNEDAAAQYGFYYKDTYYLYQSGLNPKFSNYGAGQLILGYIIENAIGKGIGICDMLRGEEWYKMRWSNDVRKKISIFASKSISGNMVMSFRKIKRACIKNTKKILPENIKEKIDRKLYR